MGSDEPSAICDVTCISIKVMNVNYVNFQRRGNKYGMYVYVYIYTIFLLDSGS